MPPDASLLARQDALAQRACHDAQAFAELYDLMMNELYGFIFKRVGHRETTEDLVADIFRKVFSHLASFSSQKGHFRTWMYRIATNVLIDHYRVHHHPGRPAPVDIEAVHHLATQDDLVSAAERADDHSYVRRHLDLLPAKHKMIVTLRYFDDYSNKEIAQMVGMSEAHVAVTLHRALKRLRAAMILANKSTI